MTALQKIAYPDKIVGTEWQAGQLISGVWVPVVGEEVPWKCPCCSNRVAAPKMAKRGGLPRGKGREGGYEVEVFKLDVGEPTEETLDNKDNWETHQVATLRQIVDKFPQHGLQTPIQVHRIIAGFYKTKKFQTIRVKRSQP